jgi:DNA polymerase phi
MTEKPNGKRELEQGSSKELLDFYWKLASDSPSERLAAAAGLIKGLNAADNEEYWQYALNRLVKGLSSSRGSSRLGFSIALSEVLNTRADHISVSEYLDLVTDHFKVSSNVSGHEERGLNFGALFAMKTLAQGPLMFKKSTSLTEYERFLNNSLELANRKPWLRESVFFTLCELVGKLSETYFDTDSAIRMTVGKVHEQGFTLTSEGIALYLSLSSEQRVEYGTDVQNGWKHGDPLANGNLHLLAKALKEVPVNEEGNTKQKGNWKPSLHFVWGKLLSELGSEKAVDRQEIKQKSKKHKSNKKQESQSQEVERVSLEEFWKSVVDEGLFAGSASAERKYWGFEILILFIQHLRHVNSLFSANLMRCLINQLSQSDRFLNKVAKRVVATIQTVAKSRPDLSAEIIESLLKVAPNFDNITKSKTIEDMIPNVPSDRISHLVSSFVAVFTNPNESDQKAIDMRRQWAVDSLLKLVKSRRHDSESIEWVQEIIDMLVKYGYFKDLGVKVSVSVANVCQSRMDSVMTLTVGLRRSDNRSWAYCALQKIVSYESDGSELLNPFEGDLLKAKQKSIKTLEKIRKKRLSSTHADSPQLEAFELLYSLVLIKVYSTDSEAATILDELQLCYNTIIGKAKNEEGDDDDQVDASQVLTEILLSFLSRKSALLRKLSETVWQTFTSQITDGSLQLLYDVLKAKETVEGQGSLFDNDDEMEVDEEGDKGEDMDDNEEEEKDNESSSESDENSDSSDEDEVLKEADQKTNAALAQALGITDHSENESGVGDEEDDDDEESMDDEQMMVLDEQLAAIFRERQKVVSEHKSGNKKKQEALEARQNMIQFKSRILDLLDIYIKNQPCSDIILSAIVPLLTVIRSTKDKTLGEKAHQILRNRLCKVKTAPTILDAKPSLSILETIHAEAKKSPNKSHSLACNQSSVFVVKVLLHHDKEIADKISAIYASSLSEWMKRPGCKVTAPMFFDVVNFISSTRKDK